MLTVTDNDGATNSISHDVALNMSVPNQPPQADFTYNPSSPNDIDAIQFTDSSSDSDGYIVNYTWDFGDGDTSYLQNPTHQYINNEMYLARLTVRDNDGATDSVSKTISVSNVDPSADFSFVADNLTVSFTDGSSDTDGYITNYTWDFGDGITGYTKNPGHEYLSYGDYMTKLTVTDDDGLTGEATKKISLHAQVPPKKPELVIGNISVSPSSPKEGNTVTFTITITNEGDGDANESTIDCLLDGEILNSSSLQKIPAGNSITTTFYLDAATGGNHAFKAAVRYGDNVDEKSINFHVSAQEEKTFPVWIVLAIVAPIVAVGALYMIFRKMRK